MEFKQQLITVLTKYAYRKVRSFIIDVNDNSILSSVDVSEIFTHKFIGRETENTC